MRFVTLSKACEEFTNLFGGFEVVNIEMINLGGGLRLAREDGGDFFVNDDFVREELQARNL